MSIRYPRRIEPSLKPVYGLTIRQLVYLGVTGFLGGAVVLGGEAAGIPLMPRAMVALGLVAVGAALAFVRIHGQPLEKWLVYVVRYHVRPRQAIWRKGEAPEFRRPPAEPPQPSPEPAKVKPITLVVSEEGEPLSPVTVVIDLAVVFSLVALTLHLWRGGLSQLTIAVMRILR